MSLFFLKAPLSMVTVNSNVNRSNVLLEYKSEESQWKNITRYMHLFRKDRWIIENISLCHNYNFKLTLFDKMGNNNTYFHNKTVYAPNKIDIVKSGYIPKKPKFMKVGNFSNGYQNISWTSSDCFDFNTYEIFYSHYKNKTENVIRNISIATTNLKMESCMFYELSIYSVLGDLYSEEFKKDIMSNPDVNEIEKIHYQINQESDSSFKLKWIPHEKHCMLNYKITFCKDSTKCKNFEIISNSSTDYIEIDFVNLNMCSKYVVEIKPIYKHFHFESRVIETTLKQLKNNEYKCLYINILSFITNTFLSAKFGVENNQTLSNIIIVVMCWLMFSFIGLIIRLIYRCISN